MKLCKPEFTTIRKDKGYYDKFLGKDFSVTLNGAPIATATLVGIKHFRNYSAIPWEVIRSDVGLSLSESLQVLEKFCGDSKVALLSFKKL
jgi:hypothetical protein